MMEILALMLRLRVSAGKSSGVQSASSRSTVKVLQPFGIQLPIFKQICRTLCLVTVHLPGQPCERLKPFVRVWGLFPKPWPRTFGSSDFGVQTP